jgi:hypothetical protein
MSVLKKGDDELGESGCGWEGDWGDVEGFVKSIGRGAWFDVRRERTNISMNKIITQGN